MTAARLTVQGWTLRLHEVLAELSAARLRWCVVCGRVGLRRWQPLCAAMPITWVCVVRAGCRSRQAVRASRQAWSWRHLVASGRPGPAWPPTGRPWHPRGPAGPGCAFHDAVAVEVEQPVGGPIGELAVLTRSRQHAAAAGWAGDRR